MSRPWRIEFKDTVPSSNLQELSETDINTILEAHDPRGAGISKTIRQEDRQPLGKKGGR